MQPVVKHFFDPDTSTITYIVSDELTKQCAIIDPVLGYDAASGRTNTIRADEVIQYIKKQGLALEWILETHIHADHITSSNYIKQNLGGKIGISTKIKEVLDCWIPIFNTFNDTKADGLQFDHLFADNEKFTVGSINFQVMHTPGHTPACACYYTEGMIFIGDTLFMPDLGTARCDFLGGCASTLYNSIQRIFSLADSTIIYLCHDYPPSTREFSFVSTIAEQKELNILINQNISKEEYINKRHARDKGLPVPRLLLPAIQANLRLGEFGNSETNGVKYIKIPINHI
ncbi:MBL fold metallo-hydrolase [Rickettsiales endosymbiont of Stachyamoeba lipophora]|uniref:MBL fold metallo-hydrolase n=1 Tax=Rickettsiales endosymbiont of Stachyamoeba lipophora TaxID=2486578 RepID=UPI000F650F15|nr:MBL fold metallo-hydrolase [Rickettsiales endosymbiont of Stachyamoeba lipophora]AZL16253.1 MBL fold metallo-hydrolase [Rickettsiales endosymbiont of Stachyamoeba lipophora]